MSYRLKVSAHQKENTCSNVFSAVNVLAGFGYLCFNFYIEFGKWDIIAQSYKTTTTAVDPKTNNTITTNWQVSTRDEAESIVMRLEEVCDRIDILQNAFLIALACSCLYSGALFIRRQYTICCKALTCKDSRWSVSMIFIAVLTCVQSMVGLFLIILLSPTSFLTCYKVIARYFCTISLSNLVMFFFFNLILSSLAKPVLNHVVPYDKLTPVGENLEVDIVTQKARRKRRTKKYNDAADEEDVALNEDDENETPYSDNKYDENTV